MNAVALPSMAAPVAADPARRRLWQQARRILVVRLDHLGDVLMSTPAIAALRAGLPDVQITLLSSQAGAAVAPLLADIDDVIAVDAPWVAAGAAQADASGGPQGEAEQRLVRRLADGGFDAAVIFTVCTQSALPAALICRMAGIGLRLAYSRENPYGLLSDWVRDTEWVGDGMRHEVQRQLDLVAAVGLRVRDTRLRLRCPEGDRARLGLRLAQAGLSAGAPYLVVHPGASAASRRWPAQRFAQAAARLAQTTGWPVVVTGSSAEQPLIDVCRAALQGEAISFREPLALGELAALIGGARLVLTNNSGPAHIAAAMGTPVVDLYALTNPQHTPWQVSARVLSHDVPCRHCLKSVCPLGHHACLLGVSVEQAVQAALDLLDETAADVPRAPPPGRLAAADPPRIYG